MNARLGRREKRPLHMQAQNFRAISCCLHRLHSAAIILFMGGNKGRQNMTSAPLARRRRDAVHCTSVGAIIKQHAAAAINLQVNETGGHHIIKMRIRGRVRLASRHYRRYSVT